MGNYRTTSLFRFSKDFESLQKVLKNGIYPNYCEEDLSFDNEICYRNTDDQFL